LSLLLLYKSDAVQVQLPLGVLSLLGNIPQADTIVPVSGPSFVRKIRRKPQPRPVIITLPTAHFYLTPMTPFMKSNACRVIQFSVPNLKITALPPSFMVKYDELINLEVFEEELLTILAAA